MKFLSKLKQKDLKGKTCLLRIDLNIKDSELDRNNLRIQAILPTIKFLIKNGAKVVLLSHRGRPNLQLTTYDLRLSLRPFAEIFSKLLKEKIEFTSTIANYSSVDYLTAVKNKIKKSGNNIFLLENLRFFDGEEKNDAKFAKTLAKLGDIYINDAFAVSHRANASVAAITKYLTSYAGLLLENEIKNLDVAAKNGKHLFVFILGGAKISDKIGLIKKFISKADYFLIGGAIANTFVKAEGLPIGASLYNADKVDFAKELLKKYGEKIILPADYFVSERQINDIGPNTAKMYSDIIKKAKTIIWNGPMGHFENPKFAEGSKAIAKAIINNKKAFAVIGGGETSTLFEGSRINADKSADIRRLIRENLRSNPRKSATLWISTGGGAMLEYLAGKKLPGIAALEKSRASLALKLGGKL